MTTITSITPLQNGNFSVLVDGYSLGNGMTVSGEIIMTADALGAILPVKLGYNPLKFYKSATQERRTGDPFLELEKMPFQFLKNAFNARLKEWFSKTDVDEELSLALMANIGKNIVSVDPNAFEILGLSREANRRYQQMSVCCSTDDDSVSNKCQCDNNSHCSC